MVSTTQAAPGSSPPSGFAPTATTAAATAKGASQAAGQRPSALVANKSQIDQVPSMRSRQGGGPRTVVPSMGPAKGLQKSSVLNGASPAGSERATMPGNADVQGRSHVGSSPWATGRPCRGSSPLGTRPGLLRLLWRAVFQPTASCHPASLVSTVTSGVNSLERAPAAAQRPPAVHMRQTLAGAAHGQVRQ